MTNVRTQPRVIAESEILVESSRQASQSECCGCPACPCGCQYGARPANAGASR